MGVHSSCLPPSYNSAAAEPSHRVTRIAQKHEVEDVFDAESNFIAVTHLRANLFMEELWKQYTRPSILKKGKYPFAVPPTRDVYLTSVRDMGRLAGCILADAKSSDGVQRINVASGSK